MFEHLQGFPPDPLLGIIERFRKDARPQKIDLGVGVYKDDDSQTPVIASVKLAEQILLEQQQSKAYLGPSGNVAFSELMSELVLGKKCSALLEGRIAALQTPGGCGALRAAAELVQCADAKAKIWVSDPTWGNHVPLLGGAGMAIESYPYYNYQQKSIDFPSMMDCLSHAPAGDLLLLHGCCHNPCGADLNHEQWRQIVALMVERGLIPLVDIAYQGFGEDLERDAFGIRLVVEQMPEALFAVSCSKNFGLYRDRVGLVGVLTETPKQAPIALANLTKIARGMYSMPPDHGAAVVAEILGNTALKQNWQEELGQMRGRIASTREALVTAMAARGISDRFGFVAQERGMFSFLGVKPTQVKTLAEEYAIYMADSSRINVAGLNSHNLDYFSDSLASILRDDE